MVRRWWAAGRRPDGGCLVHPHEDHVDLGRHRVGVREQQVGLEALAPPTRPPPMAQRSPGSITPKLSWASCQPSEISGQYIARSTTIPRSAVTSSKRAC